MSPSRLLRPLLLLIATPAFLVACAADPGVDDGAASASTDAAWSFDLPDFDFDLDFTPGWTGTCRERDGDRSDPTGVFFHKEPGTALGPNLRIVTVPLVCSAIAGRNGTWKGAVASQNHCRYVWHPAAGDPPVDVQALKDEMKRLFLGTWDENDRRNRSDIFFDCQPRTVQNGKVEPTSTRRYDETTCEGACNLHPRVSPCGSCARLDAGSNELVVTLPSGFALRGLEVAIPYLTSEGQSQPYRAYFKPGGAQLVRVPLDPTLRRRLTTGSYAVHADI